MEVDARIAGILGRGRGIGMVFAPEALMCCPGLDQGSIDREVLVGEQALSAGLTQYRGKEAVGYLTRQQAIPILTEHGGIPYPLIEAQSHEPTEQKVVIQLLHQQPLTAHR